MTMYKSKRQVLVIIGLLLVTFAAYYTTGGHVFAALFGFLAVDLFVMADIFRTAGKDDEEVNRKIFRRKKRNLIVVGILGTGTAVALVALIIAYFIGLVQFI